MSLCICYIECTLTTAKPGQYILILVTRHTLISFQQRMNVPRAPLAVFYHQSKIDAAVFSASITDTNHDGWSCKHIPSMWKKSFQFITMQLLSPKRSPKLSPILHITNFQCSNPIHLSTVDFPVKACLPLILIILLFNPLIICDSDTLLEHKGPGYTVIRQFEISYWTSVSPDCAIGLLKIQF